MRLSQKKLLLLSYLTIFIISYSIFTSNSINLDENKLDLVFLLHANQVNVPYGNVANDLCYHAVLETMLAHPKLLLPLHISGTLLTDLSFFHVQENY